MEKEFVPYKIALQLKELGFNEPCLAFYNTKVDESLSFVDLFGFVDEKIIDDYYYNSLGLYVSAPTFSQAFTFFREKYNLFGQVNIHTYFIYDISTPEIVKEYDKLTKTYKETELACLIKLIEITKNKI